MTGQSLVNTFHTSTTSICACLLLVYFEYANKGYVDRYRQKECTANWCLFFIQICEKSNVWKESFVSIVESRPLQNIIFQMSDVKISQNPRLVCTNRKNRRSSRIYGVNNKKYSLNQYWEKINQFSRVIGLYSVYKEYRKLIFHLIGQ